MDFYINLNVKDNTYAIYNKHDEFTKESADIDAAWCNIIGVNKYKPNIYNDIISSGNKIIFTDPSLNDESEEEEPEETISEEDDDFKW